MEGDFGQVLGRVFVIRCDGPLDGRAAAPERIAQQARGARVLLVDATAAPYADSEGLRWLLRLRQLAGEAGQCLRIAARRGGRVWRNLMLLHYDFEIFASARSAWESPCLAPEGQRVERKPRRRILQRVVPEADNPKLPAGQQ